MSDNISQIAQVSEETQAAIRRKTAEMLPDNPTEHGMKAADIKRAFYQGITDGNLSVLAEIMRVIGEINTALESVKKYVDNEAVADLDKTSPGYDYVYAKTDGNVLIPMTVVSLANSIVQRDACGSFYVPEPMNALHPISKDYFDKNIKEAISDIAYDQSNGDLILSFVNGTDATKKTVELPLERLVKSGTYNTETKKIVLEFDSGETTEIPVDALITAWEKSLSDATGATVPPEAKAVVEYVKAKLKELTDTLVTSFESLTDDNKSNPPTASAVKEYVDTENEKNVKRLPPIPSIYPSVYVEEASGNTEVIKATPNSTPNTLVMRNDEGYFSIKREPTSSSHPIPKYYFDNIENNSLKSAFDELTRRTDNLEAASSGKLYENVTLDGISSAVQTEDALPYGILSRIGGFSHWSGDNAISIGADEIDIPASILEGESFAVVSQRAEDSDALLRATVYYDNEMGHYAVEYTFSANEKSVILLETNPVSGTWQWEGKHSANVVYGNTRFITNTPVSRIATGLLYTLEGAAVYNGSGLNYMRKAQLTENGAIAPKGSTYGIFFSCDIPAGATVTVYADGVTDGTDTLRSYQLLDENPLGSGQYKSAQANLGVPLTVEKACTKLFIMKTSAATPFEEDMEIRNIRIEIDDPNHGSVMTVLEEIEIPEEITSLEGYGVGVNDECYNYLDLTNRQFIRVCRLEGENVTVLDEPETVDVSEYIPEEFDVLFLAPYCLIRFESESGEQTSAPYSLFYQKKI